MSKTAKIKFGAGPSRGFGLLEIIISASLISISLFSLAAVSRLSFKAVSEGLNGIKAGYLAEETVEALRMTRDDSWNNLAALSLGQPYHLLFSGDVWLATTSPQLIDGLFSRTFILESVFRDAQDNISLTGENDPSSRKIIARVSWGAKSKEVITYITNIFGD